MAVAAAAAVPPLPPLWDRSETPLLCLAGKWSIKNKANEAANAACPCPCSWLPLKVERKQNELIMMPAKLAIKRFITRLKHGTCPAVLWPAWLISTSLSPPPPLPSGRTICIFQQRLSLKWKRSFPCALCKLIKHSQGDNNSVPNSLSHP